MEKNEKKKRFLAAIVILLLAGVVWFTVYQGERSQSGYEKGVSEITKMDTSKRQEQVDQIVADGQMNVQYSAGAVFDGKVSKGFEIKNIPENHHPIVFSIEDETGRKLYQSSKIAPGYELDEIELQTELSKGTHDCTITIGYAEEGNVSSSFPITLEVR